MQTVSAVLFKTLRNTDHLQDVPNPPSAVRHGAADWQNIRLRYQHADDLFRIFIRRNGAEGIQFLQKIICLRMILGIETQRIPEAAAAAAGADFRQFVRAEREDRRRKDFNQRYVPCRIIHDSQHSRQE